MKHLLLTTIAAVVLVGTAFADPIHDAARTGNLNAVQTELDKGVDVNARDNDGWPPLHRAAWGGYKEIIKLLLANGADVNAMDVGGWLPLHRAAWKGHKEVAELLITKGANVNAEDGGWRYAARLGHRNKPHRNRRTPPQTRRQDG